MSVCSALIISYSLVIVWGFDSNYLYSSQDTSIYIRKSAYIAVKAVIIRYIIRRYLSPNETKCRIVTESLFDHNDIKHFICIVEVIL